MDEKLLSPKGTELICENIVNTKFEDLSEENIKLFKRRLLDMVGCILGGAIVKENFFLEEQLMKWGGLDEAPVFASEGKRLPLPSAVLLNSIKARSNDYGSMMFKMKEDAMPSHMGETLIPLGLTLADTFEVSGKEFITNDIAAEDSMARLLYTLPVRFPVDMLLVSSAATAEAARYYKLDKEQLKNAFGYSVTNATDPGNSYYDYSEEFRYHNGASAQMGIMAALLAKGGWRGLVDPFYGQGGIVSSRVKDGNYPPLYEEIFEDLGKKYYTEIAFKVSPGGIPMTAMTYIGKDLYAQINAKYGKVEAADMKAVHVYGARNAYHGYYSNPFTLKNQVNALFAYRFAATAAILYDGIKIKYMQTDYINEHPDLMRLAEEATMDIFDPEDGVARMRVVVEMKDGTSFEASEKFFIMERPLTDEMLIEKFMNQFEAYGKLPKANAEKIIELSGKIEELDNMKEFTSLFV